jgi:hypothetical protein
VHDAPYIAGCQAVLVFFSARLRAWGTQLSVERGLMSRLRIAWMGQTRRRHFGALGPIRAHLSEEVQIR